MSEPRASSLADLLACVAGFGRSMQAVFDPQRVLPALRTPQALRPDRVTTARGANRPHPSIVCSCTMVVRLHTTDVRPHTPIRFSNVTFACGAPNTLILRHLPPNSTSARLMH